MTSKVDCKVMVSGGILKSGTIRFFEKKCNRSRSFGNTETRCSQYFLALETIALMKF